VGDQSYDRPVECTFDYPITPTSCISRLTAQIGDKIVEGRVQEKEVAKEKYDDAIAAGHTAARRDQHQKVVCIVPLGQSASQAGVYHNVCYGRGY
jgi:Ca-activated chloride channel homolog